jgi:hypothetical protein
MAASDSSGLFLLLAFAALLLFTVFLVFKRSSQGVFGSKLLIFISAGLTIIVFFFAKGPITGYYKTMFRDAPYSFTNLQSFVFKYGVKDSLLNQYDSATGEYQYLNRSDSLIKSHFSLTTSDLLYLHHKAVEAGFWDFPAKEVNTDTVNTNGIKPTEYLIQFNYRGKSKTVLFSANYNGPQPIVEANQLLITEIQQVLKAAQERQKK